MKSAKEIFEAMQIDFDFDYFYFSDLIRYVIRAPIENDQVIEHEYTYGKNEEMIAKDAVTLLKFLLSTGNYRVKKDVISEEFSFLPETFINDKDMVLLEEFFLKMLKRDSVLYSFDALYEIERIDSEKNFPEYIPDEVAAIFKKVTD